MGADEDWEDDDEPRGAAECFECNGTGRVGPYREQCMRCRGTGTIEWDDRRWDDDKDDEDNESE